MSVLTLVPAKRHLNITGDANDSEVQDFIDAAEGAIVERCGPLAPVSVTARVDGLAATLILPTSPAVSLTSVTEVGGAAVNTAILHLRARAGIVEYLDGVTLFTGTRYDVVYQAGRATVPADLMLAVKELLRHLWQTQRGVSRPATATSEGLSNTLYEAARTFPFRVEQLIAPHEQNDI